MDLIRRSDAVKAWKDRQATFDTTGKYELLGDLEHNIPSVPLFKSGNKKENPMKPIMKIITDIPHQPIVVVYCPRCKDRIRTDQREVIYCNHCGQKIGWDALEKEKDI